MLPEDNPRPIIGESPLALERLNDWLTQSDLLTQIIDIQQFGGGYSNLTYWVKTADAQEFVLRRPPVGAKDIKRGHDMAREFRVLEALQKADFDKAPRAVLLCEDESVIGAPFYLMERVKGCILRADTAPKLDLKPEQLRTLSTALADNLAALHALDIQKSSLVALGKPEGYIQRQVAGWQQRYENAATDELRVMEALHQWLLQHTPAEQAPAFIHNDYKFDNIVLDVKDLSQIKTMLDWEMSTVADPLMDLGVALSYWVSPAETDLEKTFNLSWLPGCLSREEFTARYAEKSGRDVSNILFYYVYGLFKNAVVLQQIYARWKKGQSADKRFARLIHGVKALAQRAEKAVERGRM